MWRQDQADTELTARIRRAEEYASQALGAANEHAVNELIGLIQDSFYQDAAHSMVAIGMLAPFIESVFRQAFRGIHEELPRRDLEKNITKIVDKVGMREYMPNDLGPTLSALFAYRNNMFHGGFEWAPNDRQQFEKRLNSSDWPSDWFGRVTSGDEPWMFYMSRIFISHCLASIEQVITGIEKFLKAWDLKHLGNSADKPIVDMESI